MNKMTVKYVYLLKFNLEYVIYCLRIIDTLQIASEIGDNLLINKTPKTLSTFYHALARKERSLLSRTMFTFDGVKMVY